ncbi:thiamine ABC transporter ATP-binding protein [Ruegeria arenilitoris]|uniref:thiamine ABC transporter ATP-binding protein n=1 Tax=Ruegeria arenilitoris TaxID=1173585 RepID=UPI001481CDCB|nr:ATP-binding cassette domain-containing protein [Ruegeria arenilitoris]
MLRLDECVIANGDFVLRANLEVADASCVAIIGPSGAGKSTLLEAIAGFRDVKGGRIFWDGEDLTKRPPGKRPVASLFQDNNLFPHLSAEQNVSLGIRPNGRVSKDERALVASALGRVGLLGMGTRKPFELSGGQQSRVALARVLVQQRDLLLLDEPFAALGPALKAEMLDLVAQLISGTNKTLLMISHDPQDARRITNKSILVADGIAHPPEPTEHLLNNPPPSLRDYLG